uniref:Uncharacterized protein n=1 Tax=Arundo donax TaxID=35708 RepID=A0A0A9FQQ9_ARUDO
MFCVKIHQLARVRDSRLSPSFVVLNRGYPRIMLYTSSNVSEAYNNTNKTCKYKLQLNIIR